MSSRKGQGRGSDEQRQGPGKGWRRGKTNKEVDIQQRVDKLLDPAITDADTGDHWETGPDDTLSGETDLLFSLDTLINLRPFKMEDLGGGLISFRTSDKVSRAVQRIKEHSHGLYDISSDLYRDIFMLGLLIMTERHQDILGIDFLIEQTRAWITMRDDVVDKVKRFAEVLEHVDSPSQRARFLSFIRMVEKRSVREKQMFLEAAGNIPLLADLLLRHDNLSSEESSN